MVWHSNGRKVSMNFHEHEKTGKPGRSFQSAAVEEMGVKPERGGETWWSAYGDLWIGHKDNGRQGSIAEAQQIPQAQNGSAMIAKIPLPLSLHIARTFKPVRSGA